jgi:hypothetical protein
MKFGVDGPFPVVRLISSERQKRPAGRKDPINLLDRGFRWHLLRFRQYLTVYAPDSTYRAFSHAEDQPCLSIVQVAAVREGGASVNEVIGFGYPWFRFATAYWQRSKEARASEKLRADCSVRRLGEQPPHPPAIHLNCPAETSFVASSGKLASSRREKKNR